MDSNGVCLRKEIIQHLLVTDIVQNWNLHYKPYVKIPNVPEIELYIIQWWCISSAFLPQRTINVNDYILLSRQKYIVI